MKDMEPPEAAMIEHSRLREEFERATKVGGETADAARAVLKVLLPHMILEEEHPSLAGAEGLPSRRDVTFEYASRR
jgi:hypothetical protein